jgi:hypothetical protein
MAKPAGDIHQADKIDNPSPTAKAPKATFWRTRQRVNCSSLQGPAFQRYHARISGKAMVAIRVVGSLQLLQVHQTKAGRNAARATDEAITHQRPPESEFSIDTPKIGCFHNAIVPETNLKFSRSNRNWTDFPLGQKVVNNLAAS